VHKSQLEQTHPNTKKIVQSGVVTHDNPPLSNLINQKLSHYLFLLQRETSSLVYPKQHKTF